MTEVEVTQAENDIAVQVMADFLGLPAEDVSPECRGAQLIREGLKRHRLASEQSSQAQIAAMREALGRIASGETSGPRGIDERPEETVWRELAACRDIARKVVLSTLGSQS